MKEPAFSWNPDTGEALCIIYDKNNTYYGTATCHPDDEDMKNEKTGCEIAFMRASLSALRHRRDELIIELKGLKKYYYSMNKSKYFDETSYPIRRLYRQMEMLQDDIDITKDLIKTQYSMLNRYIKQKGEFYAKIRHNREIDQKLAEMN